MVLMVVKVNQNKRLNNHDFVKFSFELRTVRSKSSNRSTGNVLVDVTEVYSVSHFLQNVRSALTWTTSSYVGQANGLADYLGIRKQAVMKIHTY